MRRLAAGVHAPSLAELAADRVLQHLGGRGEHVALLGVSPMTRRCAAILREANVPLVIVNRTLEAAEDLAASVSGEALSLEHFRLQPPAVSVVVLAAGGAALLDASALERLKTAASRTPLLVDFGVPPNVDPDAARRAGVSRVGMHDLIEAAQGRRLAQLVRLAPVRAAIDDRLARLRTELALRAIGPRLAELRQTFEEIAAAEVARALRGQLRTLDARERAQLERIAATLAHRLAHLPLAGLRAAAVHASSEAVEAFFEGARALRRDAVNVSDDTGET
jgi:glutamyl-tRNA reductase